MVSRVLSGQVIHCFHHMKLAGIRNLSVGFATTLAIGSTSASAQLVPTNRSFSHEIVTTASPAVLWSAWTDVENWKRWDIGLQSAMLDGPFRLGAKGELISDDGNKAKFEIAELIPDSAYTFKTQIPFGYLVVRREITNKAPVTYKHTVWFTGPLKGLFFNLLGKRYKALLPEAMNKLKEQIESTENSK